MLAETLSCSRATLCGGANHRSAVEAMVRESAFYRLVSACPQVRTLFASRQADAGLNTPSLNRSFASTASSARLRTSTWSWSCAVGAVSTEPWGRTLTAWWCVVLEVGSDTRALHPVPAAGIGRLPGFEPHAELGDEAAPRLGRRDCACVSARARIRAYGCKGELRYNRLGVSKATARLKYRRVL